VAQQRFCPADQATHAGEFCEYISSSGLPDGTVETPGVLRVNSSLNTWRIQPERHMAQAALAKVTWDVFGVELYHSCAVSEESMQCAIDDMIGEFTMEIQKLLGVNMFDMERHMEFFTLGGMLNFQCKGRNDKHPYMIKSVWQKVSLNFNVNYFYIIYNNFIFMILNL
jgi:hypothetical protein